MAYKYTTFYKFFSHKIICNGLYITLYVFKIIFKSLQIKMETGSYRVRTKNVTIHTA